MTCPHPFRSASRASPQSSSSLLDLVNSLTTRVTVHWRASLSTLKRHQRIPWMYLQHLRMLRRLRSLSRSRRQRLLRPLLGRPTLPTSSDCLLTIPYRTCIYSSKIAMRSFLFRQWTCGLQTLRDLSSIKLGFLKRQFPGCFLPPSFGSSYVTCLRRACVNGCEPRT